MFSDCSQSRKEVSHSRKDLGRAEGRVSKLGIMPRIYEVDMRSCTAGRGAGGRYEMGAVEIKVRHAPKSI